MSNPIKKRFRKKINLAPFDILSLFHFIFGQIIYIIFFHLGLNDLVIFMINIGASIAWEPIENYVIIKKGSNREKLINSVFDVLISLLGSMLIMFFYMIDSLGITIASIMLVLIELIISIMLFAWITGTKNFKDLKKRYK